MKGFGGGGREERRYCSSDFSPGVGADGKELYWSSRDACIPQLGSLLLSMRRSMFTNILSVGDSGIWPTSVQWFVGKGQMAMAT